MGAGLNKGEEKREEYIPVESLCLLNCISLCNLKYRMIYIISGTSFQGTPSGDLFHLGGVIRVTVVQMLYFILVAVEIFPPSS